MKRNLHGVELCKEAREHYTINERNQNKKMISYTTTIAGSQTKSLKQVKWVIRIQDKMMIMEFMQKFS